MDLEPDFGGKSVFTIIFNTIFYFQKVKNESEKRFFYHDRYGSFVYGVIGQKESIYQGVESSVETLLFNFFQLEMSFNIGRYYISNNPLYEILLVNDIYKVESGLLRLKNLPATTGPEITKAISIQVQPTYSTRVSLTGIYASKRAISYDYYRRSALLLDPIATQKLYTSLHDVEYLPSQFVLNASMSKSFNVKLVFFFGVKDSTEESTFGSGLNSFFEILK